jgi:hypothetical protein
MKCSKIPIEDFKRKPVNAQNLNPPQRVALNNCICG